MKVLQALVLVFVCACTASTNHPAEKNETVSEVAAEEDGLDVKWNFEGEFSDEEKTKLITWMTEVVQTNYKLLGEYPIKIYFTFKENNKQDPVTFGMTERGKQQGVVLYVNPDYSLQDFREAWEGMHEVSHLSLPFFGRSNSWLAEGYASFMQYRLLSEIGVVSEDSLKNIFEDRIQKQIEYFDSDEDLARIAARQASKHNYPALYWGGSMYWILIDHRLKTEKNQELTNIIRKYQQCCRKKFDKTEHVLELLDSIAGAPYFSNSRILFEEKSSRECLEALRNIGYFSNN